MFTHKPQANSELGVKVKGEGKYLELAECVMRRRVSAKARSKYLPSPFTFTPNSLLACGLWVNITPHLTLHR